jgi:hypothetical protein
MDGECKWARDRDRDRKREQIMGQAEGSGGVGMPSGAMQKGPSDDRHWHFGMGWVNLLSIVFLFYWLITLK